LSRELLDCVLTVASGSNLTAKDVLDALQNITSSSSSSSSSNSSSIGTVNETRSLSDERVNYYKNSAPSSGEAAELETGPISEWLSELVNNDDVQSSTSSFLSNSLLSRFVQQVRLKPGFHPNAVACVACVAFGWKPGFTLSYS